jgi:hypothetical protein
MTTRIGRFASTLVVGICLVVTPIATQAVTMRDGRMLSGNARAITIREAISFRAPFKIADLERKFGPWKPVHGGASLYPCSDKRGMEIQFVWDIPKKPSDIRRLSDYRIAFVALARASDLHWVKILWPAGMTVDQASEKNHRDLEEYTRRYPDAD